MSEKEKKIKEIISQEIIKWYTPLFCNEHEVYPCKICGNLEQSFNRVIDFYTNERKKLTRVESVNEVKELFEMIYQWGRVGIVVDYKSPVFQKGIKKIKETEYFCPADIDEAPEFGTECQICGEIV